MPARLDYVELPVPTTGLSASFFAEVFDWTMTDFGLDYAGTTTADTNIGLNGDANDATAAPLPIIRVDDLDATLAAVVQAGGTVSRPPFDFPGGRRFHFREPGGCELAAWVVTD